MDFTLLHPRLQDKLATLQSLCQNAGLPLGFSSGFRTVAEQDALYAQGRTAPGNIVTWVTGSSYGSQHQWGIAADFFKNIVGHEYDDQSFFLAVGALAKSIGLGWGGDWVPEEDRPHLYLPDWGDTTASLINQYGNPDAFIATWSSSAATLDVDGYWGPATTTRLQSIFGTIQDGMVTDQWIGYKDDNPGLIAFEWVSSPQYGSQLIRAIQTMVGATVDGFIGPNTIRAMQAYWGTTQDGYVSAPSQLVCAIQQWANQQ